MGNNYRAHFTFSRNHEKLASKGLKKLAELLTSLPVLPARTLSLHSTTITHNVLEFSLRAESALVHPSDRALHTLECFTTYKAAYTLTTNHSIMIKMEHVFPFRYGKSLRHHSRKQLPAGITSDIHTKPAILCLYNPFNNIPIPPRAVLIFSLRTYKLVVGAIESSMAFCSNNLEAIPTISLRSTS